MKYAAPLVSCAKYFNPQGFGPQLPVDIEKVPHHIFPWLYDFDNPFQRKFVPLHTLKVFNDETKRIGNMISRASSKKKQENEFNKVRVPSLTLIGSDDTAVNNGTASQVYALLPPGDKHLCEMVGVDHGAFSDGIAITLAVDMIVNWFEKYL